jgi:hypothetical protein
VVEHSSNFEFSHSCLCLSCVSHFGLRIIEFHIGSWNNSHSLEIRSPYGWACKLILEQRIKYIMFWVTLFYGKHVGHHVCSKNYVSPALKLDNVRFCAESTQNFQKQGLDTIQKTHWSHCKWRLAVAFFWCARMDGVLKKATEMLLTRSTFGSWKSRPPIVENATKNITPGKGGNSARPVFFEMKLL